MKVFCFLLIHSSTASLPIVTHTPIHQICQEWLQTSESGCNALSLWEILTICEITCYQNLFSTSPASLSLSLAGRRRILSILTAKTSSSPSVGPFVPPTKYGKKILLLIIHSVNELGGLILTESRGLKCLNDFKVIS